MSGHDTNHIIVAAGEKEIRCWVVRKGTLAPQAGKQNSRDSLYQFTY